MDMKAYVRTAAAAAAPALVTLSHAIHAHPEVGFEEHRAADLVDAELTRAGFSVTRGVAGLETALVARAGDGGVHVTLCAEYDAMPEGQVCGHNMIAAMAVGAARLLAPLAEELGLTLSVIGTPAEEGGGGKILLLDAGVFDAVDVALMVHPAPVDVLAPPLRAMSRLRVRFVGKAASAASFPEQGIDAGDAAVLAQIAVKMIREHLPPGVVVNGILTTAGERPVVVPDEATAHYVVWAPTTAQLAPACERVRRCLEAGALATGAQCEIVTDRSPGAGTPYAQMRHDSALLAMYERNALALGRTFPDVGDVVHRFAMCTDMGNVSQVVPSIHPFIGVGGTAVNHEPAFAAACTTPTADAAVVDGAVAMAWTVIDAATDPALRRRLTESARPRRVAA
jgi:amidohydrolase